MPIYVYDLNEIMSVLQANDCHNCFVRFMPPGHEVWSCFSEAKIAILLSRAGYNKPDC